MMSASLKGQARSWKEEEKKKTQQQALLDFGWITPMYSAVPANEL